MATYVLTIGGSDASGLGVVEPRWRIRSAANERKTLRFNITSSDGSYQPDLDDEIVMQEHVVCVSSSVANPSVITTAEAHGLETGQLAGISGHSGSTPDINGWHYATVLTATTFSIDVNVTVGGTGGTVLRRIFGGTATSVRVRGLGDVGQDAITSEVTATDFNLIGDRRLINTVFEADTLYAQLTRLVDEYLTDDGVVLHPVFAPTVGSPGPAMEELAVEYGTADAVLETLSVQTGYSREIDDHKYLRVCDPSGRAAPFDVTVGARNALGDVQVEQLRGNYANRVVVRFANVAREAWDYLVSDGTNFANTETVIIGSKTYTFQTVLTDSDGNVLIGASASASITNLAAAIRLAGGAGSTYAASTTEHPSVTAYETAGRSGLWLTVRAKTAGAAGNSIATTETCAHAGFIWEGGGASATLQGGQDQEVSRVVQSEDAGEIAAHGAWERVYEAPDVTTESLAQALADAYLAIGLELPVQVEYTTRGLGLSVGQQQTITLPSRGIDSTFTVVGVDTQHVAYQHVIRRVTAVGSSLVQSYQSFTKTYKEWAGKVSASAAQVGALSITTGGSSVSLLSFGGSQTEWVQPGAGAWVAANSRRIRIDTAERGSTTGTMTVRIRALNAGISVTARLREVDTPATAGTSSAVTATTFTTVSFAVSLTAGAKEYEVQLSCSASSEDVQLGVAYLQ